jgi:general secretion pathway protein J
MNRFTRRSRSSGFTLLEMMIGMVVLGLMMTVLFSGLRLGASSWDAAERRVASVAERELALRVIERQLAMALPVMHAPEGEGEPPKLAFDGEGDRVTWISPLPAYRGGGGVHELELALGVTDRGEGLVLGYRLFHPDVLDAPSATDRESVLLLEGVTELRATYYGSLEDPERGEWFDHWDHPESLPDLVKLEFDLADEAAHPITLVVQPRQAPFSSGLDFGRRR